MEGSILVHQLRKVITLVDLLRDIGLDKQLSLPKVVVLGNQSSGKSSLLEQIVGLDFLPRGSGVVTRRPLELRMNNVPDLKAPYAQFDEVMEGGKKKQFSNFNEVRKTIDIVTDKVCGQKKVIKDIPIVLNIFSPNCPNLTIVDLPGITSIPVGDQPKNIYEITRDMALRYVKQPRSIILCVIPANQDLTTSEALKLMREIDPKGERSIGCLTKIDIMNRGDDASKMLKNQEVPLRYGYVGVKNRCQEDVLNNVPVTESLKAERQFFTKSPIYSTLPRDLFGTQSLTKKLTNILYQQIKTSMPEIFEQIKHKRAAAQEELNKLGPGIANTDGQLVNYTWKSISNFMRIYTNSINGIKNTDYSADPISSEIRDQLTNLYREQYDQPATADIDDKDIQKAMINFPGDSTIPGFPSIDAFLALLNPLLKKLQTPAYSLNNRIHQIMDHEATKIINEVMLKKFPQFNSRFNELIRRVLERHRKQLENYLNMLLDAEISYLYTNDLVYLRGDFALTEKEKKKLQTGKIKDPLIFQLRKRIDSYFKLVVRNLRDLVPRQIFNFLITKCLKQLEFEAFQFTSDVKKLKEWLNEPEQIRMKRAECIKAIKVFEESEKRIKMDPQISKLIRDNKRDEKYYSKYGIKSPEEQAKQAEQAYLRQSQIMSKRLSEQQQRAGQGQGQGQGQGPSKPQPPPSFQGGQSGQGQSQGQGGQGQGQGQGQNMNKSPSQTSTSSNASGSGTAVDPKFNPNLFNMFGTNVASTQPQNAQQQPVGMPKQNPPATTGAPNSNKDGFADFWANPGSKPVVNQPPINPALNKPPNVQPLISPQNKPPTQGNFPPTQTNPNPNPNSMNPNPNNPSPNSGGQPKPADGKKSSTFNQLFGLSGNK